MLHYQVLTQKPMKTRTTPPDGIIVTISAKMYGTHGYRHWISNFLDAMKRHDDGIFYWLRCGVQPKVQDLQYVYLCIGGKIRYRCYFGGSRGAGTKEFMDGRVMDGKSWLVLSGPVEKAPTRIERKGFQGFRYTEKLF